MKIQAEYLGSIVLLVTGVFSVFGIVVDQQSILGILTGVIALFLAIKQKKEKNLSAFGVRKN